MPLPGGFTEEFPLRRQGAKAQRNKYFGFNIYNREFTRMDAKNFNADLR
jgi:hypothetical protein